MQWLARLFTPQEPPTDALRREVRALSDQVHACTSEIITLRKEWATEQLAMADLTAKLNQWVARLAARERRKAEKALAEHDPEQLDAVPAPQPRDVRSMSKAELRQLAAQRFPNGR